MLRTRSILIPGFTAGYKSLLVILVAIASANALTYYWNPTGQPGGAEAQRAFNWTSNQDGTGTSPSTDKNDEFNAGTLNPVWKFIDWTAGIPNEFGGGNKGVPASYSLANGILNLTGRGGELAWGYREIAGVYRTDITGNFDVFTRITSHEGSSPDMKTGIIIYNDFNNPKGGGGFAVMATLDRGFIVDFNEKWADGVFDASQNPDGTKYIYNTDLAPANSEYWLRAVKNGNTFSGYYKLSLTSPWILIRSGKPLGTTAANSQIGLFVCAHDPLNNAFANFGEFVGGGNILADTLNLNFGGRVGGPSVSANLTGPLSVRNITLSGYNGVLSFMGNTLTVSGDANLGGLTNLESGTGTLALVGTGVQTITALDTLPNVTHAASGAIKFGGHLTMKSFTQSGGLVNFNDYSPNVVGDFKTKNGNATTFLGLEGVTVNVGGNALLEGTPGNLLNLNPPAEWTINVAGSLIADYAAIGNSTATGMVGVATKDCRNDGSNTNWQFSGLTQLAFIRQTPDTTVLVGEKAVFSVQVEGPAPIALEWRRKGSDVVISRDAVLTITSTTLSDNGAQFQCTATNINGSTTTNYATLTVAEPAAKIIKEPLDLTVRLGETAKFSVSASGGNPKTYAWMRKGTTEVLSTDSVLSIGSTTVANNGNAFWVIVSNSTGKDSSREAKLTVKVCDSSFQVTPESLTVDESQPYTITGKAGCSDQAQWTLMSGPANTILDPKQLSLSYNAHRVLKDTLVVYQFNAGFGAQTQTKQVNVRIKNVIPDPIFSLVEPGLWNGAAKLTLKPSVSNLAELKSAKYVPTMTYQWRLTDSSIVHTKAGDSLVLVRPTKTGISFVQLCMTNGGALVCEIKKLEVQSLPNSIARHEKGFATQFQIAGGSIVYNAPVKIQIWNLQGKLLWNARGKAGETTVIGTQALKALHGGQALIEVQK